MSVQPNYGSSYGLGPELDLSDFNTVLTILGAFIGVLGLISYVVKERLYISDSLVATLLGIAFGPVAANFVRPASYGNEDRITLPFTRLVIGIQLVLAGIQLPSMYIIKQWKSILMLIIPIMTIKWVVSALVIRLVFPTLSYLESLVIGACITPTDPILANAIVKGRYAEKYVPEHLRDIISAEAGVNDGFGYPFLFLAVALLKVESRGAAIADWFVHVWLYEILLSVIYGVAVGLVARKLLQLSLHHKWVDQEFFLAYFLSLSLFVLGTCGLIGTDDLLAAFIAGNAFSYLDFYRDQTSDDSLQTTLDTLLNLSIFFWIGATMPWEAMKTIDPGWRLVVAVLAILVFGRLPWILAMWKFIPEVRSWKDSLFAGWFGPVGVGAIFYAQIALPYFADDTSYIALYQHIKPIVYATALASITVHGITVPVMRLGVKAPAGFMSLTKSFTRWTAPPVMLPVAGPSGPPSAAVSRRPSLDLVEVRRQAALSHPTASDVVQTRSPGGPTIKFVSAHEAATMSTFGRRHSQPHDAAEEV
ncbi:hypothetical protein PYCC9005_005089 [Savitreella phatthalungensis]